MEEYNFERCQAHEDTLKQIKEKLDKIYNLFLIGNGKRSFTAQLEINTLWIDEEKDRQKQNRRIWKAGIVSQVVNIAAITGLIGLLFKF